MTLVLDVPFLLVAVTVMLFYSIPITLIVLGILAIIGLMSAVVAPVFQRRLNLQLLLGARNQGFLTERIAGHETVKSQMEPGLNARYGGYLATYLQSGFETKQFANTYNTATNGLEQLMTVRTCGRHRDTAQAASDVAVLPAVGGSVPQVRG